MMPISSQSTFTSANNYQVDTFITHFEISPTDVPLIDEYQTLLKTTNKTQTQIDRFNDLQSNILRNKLILAEDFNYFQNVLINLETNFSTIYNDMIANFNAKVSNFTDKGNYDNTQTYKQWNTVSYNYQVYMSLQDNNLNNQPDISSTYWRLMAQRGLQGQAGIGLVMTGVYNNSVTYNQNQAVNYNGTIYYALQTTIGNTPYEGSAYWGIFQANVAPIVQTSQPTGINNGQVWIQTY